MIINRKVHDIVYGVTILGIVYDINNPNVQSTATGFFYRYQDRLFIVTNHHVMKNDETNQIAHILVLYPHNNNNLPSVNPCKIELYSPQNQPVWREHPDIKDIDIAVIELPQDFKNNYHIHEYSSSGFLPQEFRLNPGTDVFVIGYPYGYRDEKNNLPLFKNAMIASCYGVNFNNTQCFYIDGNIKQGMSGGPVFTKPQTVIFDENGEIVSLNKHYYLLGIVSEEWRGKITKRCGKTEEVDLGLQKVWNIQLVEDIVKTI